jgi:hypothetical protein
MITINSRDKEGKSTVRPKKAWTVEEDQILMALVDKFGEYGYW